MRNALKKIIVSAAVLCSAVLLSGCALQYGDGLLALPGLPSEYVELQEEINKVLDTGAVSAAAESGSNRQAIQMVDIDGDGEEETIAFFREADGNFLIKAYRQEKGNYIEIGSAQAVGMTLHSIYYPVVSPTGQRSLAVCWGLDEGSNYGMEVFSFEDEAMTSVLSVQYSSLFIGDLYGNSLDELCLALRDQATGQLLLRVYSPRGKIYEQDSTSFLCAEARSVSKMAVGQCTEGTRAVFIDSAAAGGGYVTDVIVPDAQGKLQNISRRLDGDTGMRTWRSIEIYSSDIDEDGIIEVPSAASMMSALYPDEKNKLSWLEYSSDGAEVKLMTYHMPSDGWYFMWPGSWDDSVVTQVTRYSRMVKTVFFRLSDEISVSNMPGADDGNSLLTVYIFSGDNNQAYVSVYEATEITRRSGRIYAFALGKNQPARYALDETEVLEGFVRINNEWSLEGY